jgi:uncharacterized protein (TIGR02145 family)
MKKITLVLIIITITGFVFAQTSNPNSCNQGHSFVKVRDIRTVTDIDSNSYPTVTIGELEWMAENLRVLHYSNGEPIPTGLTDNQWYNTTTGAYAIYPHDEINGLDSDAEVLAAYGALYNWYAVSDERGLCPANWRVPSDEEWTQLVNYLIDEYGYTNNYNDVNGIGNKLKSCRQVNSPLGGNCTTSFHPRWDSDATHFGTDEFSFSALPNGDREYDGFYANNGTDASWWTSTQHTNAANAWGRGIYHNYGYVPRYYLSKRNGSAVRCVRDAVFELTLFTNPDSLGTILYGAGIYGIGDTVSISTSTADGYFFVGWKGIPEDIVLLEDSSALATSFIMPARNVTLTATFEEDLSTYYPVIFYVDLSSVQDSINVETDVIYLTGSMFNWSEPGADPQNQMMFRVGDSWIWSKTLELKAGEYQYKYYLNAGWNGGEWQGEPNRTVSIEGNLILEDIWGNTGPSNYASILVFGFIEIENEVVFINDFNITVIVTYGTNVTALTPTVTISEAATINYVFPTVMDFSNPVEFEVTSQSGSVTNTYFVSVNTPPLYSVTFNVNMLTALNFDPDVDSVYLTGDFTGWAMPGTQGSIGMERFTNNTLEVIFSEDFEGDEFPPAGWLNVDLDEDTYGWVSNNTTNSTHTGNKCAASYSWMSSSGPLFPDNWLITPQIVNVNDSCILEYWVGSQDINWESENYGVYISSTGTSINDFSKIFSETMLDNAWHKREISLASYAGQSIYIAFRHFDCTDQYYLKIDDVTITGSGSESLIYTTTLGLETGTYQYKYFVNSGWEGGELPDSANRFVQVMYDTVVNDTWGDIYTLTLLSNPGNIGAVFAGAGNYLVGDSVNIAASVVNGYSFVGWVGNENDIALLGDSIALETSFVMPSRNITFTATYEVEGPPTFSVTFNVNLLYLIGGYFDPDADSIFITGSFFDWAIPGTLPEQQTLTRIGNSLIWTKTLEIEEGQYEYKYFLNEGWDGAEFVAINRFLSVNEDIIVDDAWACGWTIWLTFHVMNTNLDPIEGAIINIFSENKEESKYVTDENGILKIHTVWDMNAFSVSADGYHNYTGGITWSNPFIDVIMIPVGTDLYLQTLVKIFPNPFSSSIQIENTTGFSSITIANLLGQKVIEKQVDNAEQITIPTDQLVRGIYLLTLEDANGEKVVRKIVKE